MDCVDLRFAGGGETVWTFLELIVSTSECTEHSWHYFLPFKEFLLFFKKNKKSDSLLKTSSLTILTNMTSGQQSDSSASGSVAIEMTPDSIRRRATHHTRQCALFCWESTVMRDERVPTSSTSSSPKRRRHVGVSQKKKKSFKRKEGKKRTE